MKNLILFTILFQNHAQNAIKQNKNELKNVLEIEIIKKRPVEI